MHLLCTYLLCNNCIVLYETWNDYLMTEYEIYILNESILDEVWINYSTEQKMFQVQVQFKPFGLVEI